MSTSPKWVKSCRVTDSWTCQINGFEGIYIQEGDFDREDQEIQIGVAFTRVLQHRSY